MNMFCEHGAPIGGHCRACNEESEKPQQMTPELEEAVWRTLYHHPHSSAIIVQLLTGRTFKTPPPVPTDKQRQMAHDVVEELLRLHYRSLNEAMKEVIGEELEDNPYI